MGNRRLHGCLGLVVGVALSMLTTLVLGRGVHACDPGAHNRVDETFLLYFFVPALAAVLLMAWVVVGAVLAGHTLTHCVALAVTLLGLCWCALSFFWSGPTQGCPTGVPGWWPASLPAPGF